MPTHVYQPTRTPPSLSDRLLVHPLDACVAAIALMFGTLCLLALLAPQFVPSRSMGQLPLAVGLPVGAFLACGGALALVGLFWSGDVVSHGWAIERFGWVLAGGGFLTYALVVVGGNATSVYAWVSPLILGLGAALRFVAVLLIERHTRVTLAVVREVAPRD